jgi:protein-tyrosine phosphatase
MKVLVVCLGNICRSPLAEAILQDKANKAGLDWKVDSAGTNSYHIGQPPHALSQKVAQLNGLDICHQRARKFTPADAREYDLIFALANDVMEDMQDIAGGNLDVSRTFLLLDALYPGERRDVPDPWYGPEPGYHEVWELISRGCDAIISKYKMEKQPATTTHE